MFNLLSLILLYTQRFRESRLNCYATGFFGLWDACGKVEVIEQWQEALPQISQHLYKYEDIGHFVEEYKGKEIGLKILDFL